MEAFDNVGARYLVGGVLVDATGTPLPQPAPFDAFPETVRTSLEAAGILTVVDLKGKTEEDLIALEGIGKVIAKQLLELTE